MQSRRVILWVVLCGALASALVATVVLRRRNAPRLPGETRYENRPALFNTALQAARQKVRDGDFAPDDVRSLAHLYQANRLNDEAHACYVILGRAAGGLTAKDHYYLADIAEYKGDLDQAELQLRSVVESAPEYLPARLALSDVLFKSGRSDEAAKVDQDILAMTPNQPQALFALARVDLMKGDDDAAIARLGTLMTTHPEMTSGAGLLAQIFDRRGESVRANAMRQWSRQKPEPVPEDPWMDALLTDCYDIQRLALKFEEYYTSGDINLAVPLLKRVEELDPKSSIPQLLRGWSQARDHNDAEAVKEYRGALDKGGDPEKICPYMVQSLMALGRVADAAALMAEFHAKKPDSIPILIAYSQVAVKQGDQTLARTLLEKVVEREPYLTSANMSLASMLWASGDRDEAAQCLERVVQVDANDVASRALLGEYYLAKLDPVPAIPLLEQAHALAHADTPAQKNLTEMLFTAYIEAGSAEEEKGKPSEAVATYFDKAIALIPTNPNGYARKAAACAQMGHFGDAAGALQKLQALEPGNPTIYLSLGDVLYQGGDRDQARRNWQRALELTPSADTQLRDALGSRLDGPITEATFK
jgi:tetratricopeptide (TPR) repeat protein